jgi:succinate-semialdehyde dehydrogenase/glutarate-semialdehyde dehydrogenase
MTIAHLPAPGAQPSHDDVADGWHLVGADADVDAAVDAAVAACARPGQRVNRMLVEDELHDAFVAKLLERAERLRVHERPDGDSNGHAATLGEAGPFGPAQFVLDEEELLDDAWTRGARVYRYARDGRCAATILVDVTPDMTVAQIRCAGPIAAVMKRSSLRRR